MGDYLQWFVAQVWIAVFVLVGLGLVGFLLHSLVNGFDALTGQAAPKPKTPEDWRALVERNNANARAISQRMSDAQQRRKG